MSISSSFFCEHCGAANETDAHYCCFCGRPLDEEEAPATQGSSSPQVVLPVDTLLHGRYRIIKPVGQGGMGTVYRAQDIELNNRAVAIKELVVSDFGSQEASEAIESFKREATLLAGLQHANLPSVFEHFKENERWYMAMTFIQGETLEAHLERTPSKKLSSHEVLQIGKQLSSVLYYLHSQYPPIIFRDLKPANIMRTPDGQIYLIDFGVARRFKNGQKKDTIPFGSLGYAAPEQFGKAQTTPRSDIYALGATLYELLSGHEPSSTPLKFPSLQALEPSLPFKLVALITQMLEHNESKRPANMLIVEQRLREIDNTPWQAAPTYAAMVTAPSNKRPWRLVGVLCTLVAVFGLIVGGAIGDAIGVANGKSEATAAYQDNATATATAQANATATAVQALALPDPYSPQGTLALFDPLSQENQWQSYTDNDFGGSCTFKNSAFEVKQWKAGYFYHCDETNNAVFQNFAVEVTMNIIEGDCGGFALREATDGSGKMYLFEICGDMTYNIMRYLDNSGKTAITLASGNLGKASINLSNFTTAVVANHSSFDLYVNQQKVISFNDSAYSSGTLGLVADNSSSQTTIWYQNIKIWALP